MFTSTVDNAIERHNFGDFEVAFAYDECAEDPMKWSYYKFAGIERTGRDAVASDGNGRLRDFDNLREEKADASDDIETTVQCWRNEYGAEWWTKLDPECDRDQDFANDIINDFEVIDETGYELRNFAYFELKATDEYGWPEFRVAINKTSAINELGHEVQKGWKALAQEIVDVYGAWACGSVYTVGVETSDGEEEYMSGVYGDPFSRDFARETARDMGYTES